MHLRGFVVCGIIYVMKRGNMMKINELTAKAFDKAIPYTWDSLDYTEVEKLLNVFAELIVRECAYIADDMKSLDVAEGIKQHFGVKP
jgi:hypothetical protein